MLRLARPDDVALLVEWMREFYAEQGYPFEPAPHTEAIRGLVADPALGRLWWIEDAGERAGYVALCFGWSLEYQGRDAFVDDLYLRPAFRGRGLGARVMEAVEREARDLGVRALHLEVERGNDPARALYEKRGLRDTGRQLLSKRIPPP
jgi:ribosomal protein S18 acetylase RimI-like enzyme